MDIYNLQSVSCWNATQFSNYSIVRYSNYRIRLLYSNYSNYIDSMEPSQSC